MGLPTPLPGTHLAEVDCAGCGRYVLAVPEYADEALCATCGRNKIGAHTYSTPTPDSWSGGAQNTPVVALTRPVNPRVSATVTVICPRCTWRHRAAHIDDIAPMLKLHHQLRHDRQGWASGKLGGARR